MRWGRSALENESRKHRVEIHQDQAGAPTEELPTTRSEIVEVVPDVAHEAHKVAQLARMIPAVAAVQNARQRLPVD